MKRVNRLKMSPVNKNHHPKNTIPSMKEAAVGISSSKKVFLKILQNSQESTCDGVFF